MGSVVLPYKAPTLRRNSYNCSNPPPLPPRRNTVAVPPLKLHSVTLSGGMDSRGYYRPSSPRGRVVNPARSSTGTFADPYYDSAYYGRGHNTSPRSSADRIAAPTSSTYSYATPSSSSGSRAANLKYDSYTGRPRRNTLNESDDRLVRPNIREIAPAAAAIPIRTHHHHHHLDRPSSPLARSWDKRGETYITSGGPSRSQHKRIYSVDDNSHQSQLVAERELVEPRRRDSQDTRGYNVTSGGRTYHGHSTKPAARTAELLNDEGYSYTDPASMYRDTEPAWRRPRSGSVERSSRPSSLLVERGPRTSDRTLGPPPSTRGFDKINNGVPRSGSVRDHHARSSSIDRAREAPKYDPYPDAAPSRSSSTRHAAPAIHQEPREHRRDTYPDDYERRDREPENRRHSTVNQFEDREVATRGFGIAAGPPALAQDHHALDRQPIWNAQEVGRSRPDEYGTQYYTSDRADARMPDPRIPPEPRVPEPRVSRDRDIAPTYEERPRERDRDRRERTSDERLHIPASAPAAAAGAVAGVAATYGAAEILKSRDRDRDRDRNQDLEKERERERRREHDERDRRDKDERRDRAPDERRERAPERSSDERLAPAAAAFASTQEPDRKPRERRYIDDDDNEDDRKRRERRPDDEGRNRDRRSRRGPSSDDSDEDRPHHYADREAAREPERRQDSAAKEAALDPDEEYRRRIQQEAERSRAGRDRDYTEDDKEKDRRRRKEERDRSRDRAVDVRSRSSPSNVAEPAHSRYNERSRSVLDTDIVQEPDSLNSPVEGRDQSNKSVQIVAPPDKPAPQPKGILRKPTTKFPEDPDPIREGVAPHKSALKGKEIPPGARWTKIDRRLVNPEALEEAKERYEERMDCVIVLRVLTKQDIQKLADRTKKIRESRGMLISY